MSQNLNADASTRGRSSVTKCGHHIDAVRTSGTKRSGIGLVSTVARRITATGFCSEVAHGSSSATALAATQAVKRLVRINQA